MDVLTRTPRLLRSAWFALWALSACVPNVDTDDSTVTGPVVLAVQADPAEAAEGERVTYRALFVDQHGESASGKLSWFDCTAQKPVAELGPVSQQCFDQSSGKLIAIGKGAKVRGDMPIDACSLFGPNPPAPDGDGPPGRPADADGTGGYKLPIVLGVKPDHGEGKTVLFEQRIACGLSAVSQDLSADYATHYRNNTNPRISGIVAIREDGSKLTLGGNDALELKHGERVELQALWPRCPSQGKCGDGICSIDESLSGTDDACPEDCTEPKGCAGQETYLWFNPRTRELVPRLESMSVAWYATSGEYDFERTGVGEDEAARGSANYWTAPASGASATLWTVARDARGGVGYRALKVTLR